MAGRKWRFYENRMLKKFFNTERRLQEVQSKGGCDGHNDWLAVELCQHSVPDWIKKELQQAIDDRFDNGKELLPIAVIREKFQKDEDSLVVLRLKDWHEHFGE